jgi:hypothetical protein
MDDLLSKKEAIDFLGLDEKVFENYFKNAKEFEAEKRLTPRARFKFDKNKLTAWKKAYEWRTVSLNRDEYNDCLDFALAMHFRGYVMSDWGTGRQREFGQKITNWVKGQLGEVGVKKFLKQKFDCDVLLDFNIYGEIVPQDVIGIVSDGKTREPKLGIGIKSSKPKNVALVLGANEIEIESRSSDVYIFCRPDLPDDHLLRIAKKELVASVSDKQHFDTYKDVIPELEDIACEIAGFCYKEELEKVTSIPGQEFDNGYRYVRFSGRLHRSPDEWRDLLSKL